MPKGSDLLVAALANEGVERIFGVPGEENLDVVESRRNSRIELILTRQRVLVDELRAKVKSVEEPAERR